VKDGSLIVFEGIDGSGKSSQLALLADALRADGHEVVETGEPYDSEPGRKIREMARTPEGVAPEQELEWFLEQRRVHVRELLGPALTAGHLVLSDRYFLSTVAYQGARGLDAAAILHANESEFPLPDLALIFEVDVAEGLSRVAARGGVMEPAFEEVGFLSEVAKVFASLDRPYIERIDGSRDLESVERDVMDRITRRLDPMD